jgi:DNA-binding Lrp family transcriptional regulator
MDEIARRLLDDYQHALPLASRPFAAIADALGTSESRVLETLRALLGAGTVSRIGAVFRPGARGPSTLAAAAVPPARLDAAAERVSALPEVNHNYSREHRYNLWFVASAPTLAGLDEVLDRAAELARAPVIALPMVEEYHIDLGFPLEGGPKRRVPPDGAPALLDGACDRRLAAALDDGLAPVPQPYAELAARAGLTEVETLARLARWQATRLVRRFGVIVRHHELGWRANAMAVWDVPDDAVRRFGERLAAAEGVTLAYRRSRARPDWRYNLYCMIHGRERAAVQARIGALNRDLHLGIFPHATLFSVRRYKQTGARFAAPGTLAHG